MRKDRITTHPSQERVRELLDYDPGTGIANWRPYNALYARLDGRPAGYCSSSAGRWMQIEIDYRAYALHSIIWLHVHGRWPDGIIEHLDGDQTNNRLSNLREVPKDLVDYSNAPLTLERLHALLSYDPLTGLFAWRHRRGAAKMKGYWGLNDSGYILIRIDRRPYRAHRLAWFYVYGRWPTHHIDHINGIRVDNRIANLREATIGQNNANSRLFRTNTSGYRGVTKAPNGGWIAQISRNNRCVRLGRYATKEQAFAAYMAAAQQQFGEFCPPTEKAKAKTKVS